ncbi:MAG: tRNA (adenosine(37)-N6)-threonylcarbamoyltransferase complex transferase subunit TsaD, partial [Patescibacteria group bacterium]|nr:tRNA (adenosine(37)-N6)-threonylcarbamoyltransferase complex transferase subunit TsaD [Patescibacteria group bacterium]
FPALALVVSGGHTELVLMKNARSFRLVGATLDDAAGEAFDKVGKILGLPYPGGPAVSAAAERGNATAIAFPHPMEHSRDFNFSYSGLKTAVLYHVRNRRITGRERADIAASFQKTVVDSLVPKTIAAAKKYDVKTVILGGGVAANGPLREQLQTHVEALGRRFVVPDFAYCTDNAAMVVAAGYFGKPVPWRKISVDANRPIIK